MIHGIGADLLDSRRIRSGLARFGEAYVRRLLVAAEWDGFAASPDPARFLAKAFAAKEAFSKACGTGLRAPVTLANLAVLRDPLGKPHFLCAPELSLWLAERGIVRQHLSLSDEGELVLAYVILESE